MKMEYFLVLVEHKNFRPLQGNKMGWKNSEFVNNQDTKIIVLKLANYSESPVSCH